MVVAVVEGIQVGYFHGIVGNVMRLTIEETLKKPLTKRNFRIDKE